MDQAGPGIPRTGRSPEGHKLLQERPGPGGPARGKGEFNKPGAGRTKWSLLSGLHARKARFEDANKSELTVLIARWRDKRLEID